MCRQDNDDEPDPTPTVGHVEEKATTTNNKQHQHLKDESTSLHENGGHHTTNDDDNDDVVVDNKDKSQLPQPQSQPQGQERPANLMANAPWWSRLFFYWPYPLLKLGLERPLVEGDLPCILERDTSKYNKDYLQTLWEEECQQCAQSAHHHNEIQNENQNQIPSTTTTQRGPRPPPTTTTTGRQPSLHRALLRDFFRSIWYVQPLMAAAATAKIVQAVALGRLIETFEVNAAAAAAAASSAAADNNNNDGAGTSGGGGWQWAGVLVACGVVILMEHHHVFFVTWRKGMQLRISCVASIYAKSLRLSSTSSTSMTSTTSTTHQNQDPSSSLPSSSSSTGQILNLASNDVERFLLAALFASHLIWSPLQALSILAVGWMQVGYAFGAGFALLVLGFVPFQFYLSHRFAHFRSHIAGLTDRRVHLVSQAVHGARVMKMSGYEWNFLDRIGQWRQREVGQIQTANRLKAWNEATFFSANVVISLVIFLVVVLTGGTLTAGSVFTVFTLLNILQLELTKHMSLGVMGVSEVFVSITRIQHFLQFPELAVVDNDADKKDSDVVDNGGSDSYKDEKVTAVSLSHVDCYWNYVQTVDPTKRVNERTMLGATDVGNLVPALTDINVSFQCGQLTCVIGTVGCGKSALLQAIVGELPIYAGIMERNYRTSSLAYAAQDPWIMDGTVRENITMGQDFDQTWYDQVVDACSLRHDFGIFRNGDQTIVGDRGIQCSGGQRARIGLARALYRDPDVLVADDPLSAVDTKVGKQIFYEALLGLAVNRGKCVVLATHQHQYVHDHRCILISNGRVDADGTYEQCVEAAGGALTIHNKAGGVEMDNLVFAVPDAVDDSTDDFESKLLTTDVFEEPSVAHVKTEAVTDDTKEKKVAGMVQWDTYVNYIKAMGGLWVAGVLLLTFCATQGTVLWAVATMGRWAERPPSEQDSWDILGLVIGQGFLVIFLSIFRAMYSFRMCIMASKALHDNMTKAILRAKISFFDTNPLGRVLNRFSADVGSNDDLLPQTLFDFTVILFIVAGALCTTVVSLPFALLAIPPLLYYFIHIRRIFVSSTRELKRLEGLARSPIFAMMSESISGVGTIRANNAINYFVRKFEAAHDGHTRAFFSFIAASRWVGFRMDALVFLLMSMVSFLAVLFNTKGWFSIDPAILGLSLSMLLQLAGLFQWCIRQSAEVVNQMVSVERVLEFGNIEPEAPLELESDKQLEPSWPNHGALHVQDLAVRYRPNLPLALNGVTFSVPSGARVGVVGRTGSGKSSLVQTLFRLLEADRGYIEIDNVDIANVGLHRLRTRISVIPQVPTLFSGCTVRENLDLFGLHSKEAILQALSDSHLKDVIAELPNGIDSIVSEGGSNFSVGQRQLLCLARAILSKSRLLILDEATASVDRRTDQMLHDSLHQSFDDATILAVAHRLDTVIDHDYILVLGNGKVLEFGPPGDLLRTAHGAFSEMVEDTGPVTSKELRRRAFAKRKEE